MSTILVVDDSRFSRKAVVTALAGIDAQIVQACNGREALEQLDAANPELVVTDLLMPEMDGLEFLAELRARGDERPVCVVSADIQESSRGECERLGAYGFFNKPFRGEELVEAAQRALSEAKGEVVCN